MSILQLQILSFQALADCIRSAPGPMRPFAEKIERACLSHIDSPHRTLVQVHDNVFSEPCLVAQLRYIVE